jgi:hypothetical protein
MITTKQEIQITDRSYTEISEDFIMMNLLMFSSKTGNELEIVKGKILDLLLSVDKDYRDNGRYNSLKKNLNR